LPLRIEIGITLNVCRLQVQKVAMIVQS